MNVTYSCLKCDAPNHSDITDGLAELRCSNCGQALAMPRDAVEQGHLGRCLVCPSSDLFVRKDFPQRLGVGIVTAGLLASCVAWAYSRLYLTFGILFATALVDVLLYVLVPNALMCYRCGAMYRGIASMDDHNSFELETHERHRQQKIRLAGLRQAEVQDRG
jgi:DNA-directed RNA polymerase subunit RPC12/RpoP